MAKISRVSLARKRELEKPDAVLSFLQQASLWLSTNKQQATIAAGAVLAVIIFVAVGTYVYSQAKEKAFNRLTRIMQVTPDPSGAAASTAEEYKQLNKKYSHTTAGKIAGLKYADACYQAGDYENAITSYQKALSDFKNTPFFKIMALNGLGYSYESSGKYDQAITAFKKILDDPKASIKDETLFNLGRLYERQGDLKSSRGMFDRILADHPDSFYATLVRESNGDLQSDS